MNCEKYIGLDVHQSTIAVAVRDSKGKVVMESILETKASTILEFLRGFSDWKVRQAHISLKGWSFVYETSMLAGSNQTACRAKRHKMRDTSKIENRTTSRLIRRSCEGDTHRDHENSSGRQIQLRDDWRFGLLWDGTGLCALGKFGVEFRSDQHGK